MSEPLHELAGVNQEDLERLYNEYVTTDMDESVYEYRLDSLCEFGLDPEYADDGEVLFEELRSLVLSTDKDIDDDTRILLNKDDWRSIMDYAANQRFRLPNYEPMSGTVVCGVQLRWEWNYKGEPKLIDVSEIDEIVSEPHGGGEPA